MSVLSLERYAVTDASRDEFEPLLAELLAAMRRQPGLLWADGGRTSDDGGYVLLSEWRTAGDLDAWQATAILETWEASTDPMLATDAMRRRFSPGA